MSDNLTHEQQLALIEAQTRLQETINYRAEIFQNVLRNMETKMSNTISNTVTNVSGAMERLFRNPTAQARPPAPQFSQLPFEQQLAQIQAETRLQEGINFSAEIFGNIMNNGLNAITNAITNSVASVCRVGLTYINLIIRPIAPARPYGEEQNDDANDDANGEEQNMNRE